jgi:DNA mismatch repair protein MutL
MNAYDGLLRDNNQPSYFLFLEVPPHTIDINIHPTKTEVKFDDEQALYAILRATVKHSLGMFNVAPILDFERDANLDVPYDYKDKTLDTPTIQVDRSFNPFESETKKQSGLPAYEKSKSAQPHWESLYTDLKQDTFEVTTTNFENDLVNSTLFDDKTSESKSLLYQLNRKYILNSIKSGLLVIHQSRAHQRILYEQFLTNITIHQASSQQLLFPLEIQFSRDEMLYLKEIQPNLEGIGFAFEKMGLDVLIISGLPAQISESNVTEILHDLIYNLQENVPEDSFSLSDSISKFMAKSVAIKSGKYLNTIELENIVNGLFACKDPNVSPFQKPIFITLTTEDLDKRF